MYEGSLGDKELEPERRQYICLNGYYKYVLDSKGKPEDPYIEDHEKEPEETVMIFYDSIKRIEKRKIWKNYKCDFSMMRIDKGLYTTVIYGYVKSG